MILLYITVAGTAISDFVDGCLCFRRLRRQNVCSFLACHAPIVGGPGVRDFVHSTLVAPMP